MNTLKNNTNSKKGEQNMSLIRKELAIVGYERLIEAYLQVYDFNPTNGKFIASRPWLTIDKINKRFAIDYKSFMNEEFDANQRDIFINYLFTDEQVIDEDKIKKLIGDKPEKGLNQNFTKRLRACEKFMFKQQTKDDTKKQSKKSNVVSDNKEKLFYTRKFAPSITKGPVDDICLAVASKDNFKPYEDIFDIEEKEKNRILIENYGYEYLKDNISLTIDAINSDGEYVDNVDELELFKNQLDIQLTKASQYLSHETEKLLRYIQTIRYIESLEKPVIDGYSANIDVDIDDILRAFNQKICPENRMKILNQFVQIGNLSLNIKVADGVNFKTAKKRTKNNVLYFSSKLINLSFLVTCASKNKESNEVSLDSNITNIHEIDAKSIKNVKVKFSWTDCFEKLYKDGSEFLNLNMPIELFRLPRYQIKDFNLGMYIAKLANSTLSNKRNKAKSSVVGFEKILKNINMLEEIENTTRKSEKLKDAFKVIEHVFSIFIDDGIITPETLTLFKESKKLVTAKNYTDFKIFIYYQNKSSIDNLIQEDLKPNLK